MQIVKDHWDYISSIGIDSDMENRMMRKVKLTNQITFVACSMTMFQIFLFPLVPGYTFLCLACMAGYAITWILNNKKMWNASRLYFCIASCLGIVISGSLLSDDSNLAFRFILLQSFVLPIVVFDITETKYMIFGLVMYIACLINFDVINEMIPAIKGVDTTIFANPMNVMVNSVLCLITFFLGSRYLQSVNFKAEDKLAESLIKAKQQSKDIEQKNKDIEEGVSYSQQIQQAILPNPEQIRAVLPDHFVHYSTKEKIGGDFFWHGESGDHIIIATVDCTGHGTPGALISIIGSKLLDKIVKDQGETNPAEILNLLNLEMIKSLNSETSLIKEEMDMSLLSINTVNRTVTFAGAKNSLLHISDGQINRTRGNSASIGDHHILEDGFSNVDIEVKRKDCFYLMTDGAIDQFGGPKNKKMKYKTLFSILGKNQEYSMDLQHDCLLKEFSAWTGGNEQVDDILIIGFRIDFDHIASVRAFKRNSEKKRTDRYAAAS